MRMKDAARRFNDAQAYDAYTGDELFQCAFTSFDDHASSGATARRRVLSLTETDVVPARSAINLFEEIWLVGAGAADSFAGGIIRRAYGMKRATDLAQIGTPGQAILGTGAVSAYIQRQFFKDTFDTRTESDSNVAWNVFLSPAEMIAEGSFIVTPEMKLRVRNLYLPVEGLRVAECDELETGASYAAVFIANGTYNSATDSYAVVNTAAQVFAVDYNKLYRLHTEADDVYQPGDLAVLVPKVSVTPVIGAQFTMNSLTWRVLTAQSELDCWLLHARIG